MNNPTDKMIWVEQPNEPPTDLIGKPPSMLIRYGSGVIVILLILILVFSYFIRLPEVVHAEAFIRVGPVPVIIRSPVPGRLEFLVGDGQWIGKGSALFVVGGMPVMSPLGGRVAFLQFTDSARTGDSVMVVMDTGTARPPDPTDPAPGKTTCYATLRLPVEGAGKIRPGQEVTFILPVFPARQFGTLRGRVERLSGLPVGGNYLVTVALPQGLITDTRYRIAGFTCLTGTADIVIKSRSLLERIFKRSL